MGNKYHYTIYDFFSFVNEKKKSCTKTQEEIKFKDSFANSFLSSGD